MVATADCGDWLKVKIHTTDKEEDPSTKNAPKKQQQQAMAWGWGWCLRRYKDQEFLVSANGIIIDDVVEALNLNAHYNISKDAKKKKDSDKHKSISPDALPTDSDAVRVKSSKESRFSPPLFDGKKTTPILHRSKRSRATRKIQQSYRPHCRIYPPQPPRA